MKMKSIVANGLMVVGRPLKREEPPFSGLQVILYLRAGTDSAQPIRVVRDSCIKGSASKMLAHILRNFDIQ